MSRLTLLFGLFLLIAPNAWCKIDSAQTIKSHVLTLTASQTGRAPGTKGHADAKAYLIEQMKQLGLAPSGLADAQDPQNYVVQEWMDSSPLRHTLGYLLARGFPMAQSGPKEVNGYPVYNLVGVIKSRDPKVKQWRLLITHYDHLARMNGKLYPGALDNGAGVATHLETIRLIQEYLRENPSATLPAHLMFAFTDREEISNIGVALIGARLLKTRIEKRWGNLDQLSVIAMDLLGVNMIEGSNLDLSVLGAEDIDQNCAHFSSYFESSQFHMICAPVSILEGGRFPITLFPKDMLDRCDYAPFRDAGIKSLFLTAGSPWFYHTPEDKPERLNVEKLASIAHSLSKILQASPLENWMTTKLLQTPQNYSEKTIEQIMESNQALLKAKDFYPLLGKEIAQIEANQKALLACKKAGCNQNNTRQQVFDLLFILHQAGKRRIMEHG